jgi:CheY-like chemotaxis protein
MATILLVDDEPDIRSLVRDVLGPQGYRILEAGNADEALRVAQEHGKPIDLLLTDVVMPGMHGHELAAQLLVQRPGLKVLYMSGFALVQDQHEMMEARAGLEPGSPILAKALQRRRPHQEGERAARPAERISFPICTRRAATRGATRPSLMAADPTLHVGSRIHPARMICSVPRPAAGCKKLPGQRRRPASRSAGRFGVSRIAVAV